MVPTIAEARASAWDAVTLAGSWPREVVLNAWLGEGVEAYQQVEQIRFQSRKFRELDPDA